MAPEPSYAQLKKEIEELEKENAALKELRDSQKDEAARRKQAEAALEECEHRYRSLVEEAPVGIFQTTSDGRSISINPHMAKMVAGDLPDAGVPLFTDLSSELYADPGKREAFIRRLDEEGELQGFEYEAVCLDGKHRWFSMNARVSRRFADGTFAIEGFTTDITRLKEVENRLRLSQFGIDNAAIGIFMINEDSHITYANRYACQKLGYQAEELCRLTVFDIDPTFGKDSWRRHRAAIREKGYGTIESLQKRKDGTTFPVEVTVTYMQYAGRPFSFSFVQDITARKQIADSLQKSERILRETQRITRVGGWEYSVDSGRMYWTDEVFRIYEVSPDDHDPSDIGKDLSFYPPEEREVVANAFYHALDEGTGYDLELRLITAAGREIWVRTTARAEILNSRVVRLVGNIMDITEARTAQNQRLELEKQLQQAQKMEAVGRLAGGVAHDFNNLLSIILGYSELILDTPPGEPADKDALEQIHAAGERAKGLTRQLLAFSRKQVLELRSVDANKVVAGFKSLIQRIIGEDVDLRIKLASAPLYVKADAAQIEQVLMNLAVNARDAMPGGGVLVIETSTVILDEKDVSDRPELEAGPHVLISMADSGSGMDTETRQRIFEPFFSTKGDEKGSGLGLATCYGIIKQHGGHIRVYSEPGKGTVFRIYLPYAEGQSSEPEAKEASPTGSSQASATILVVEDDPAVRRLACEVLKKNGFRVMAAERADQALALAAGHSSSIDLVLADVIMPDMKGPEIFREISVYHPAAKVIYMSGYTDDVIAQHGILEEGIDFIQKPFPVKKLAAKVNQVVNKK